MIDIIFIMTILSETLLLILVLASILYPDRRIWPPPRKWSKEYIIVWSLTFISIGGLVILALLTWDTFVISNWLVKVFGVILFIGGNALALWGLAELGIHASSGLEYRLVTTGPYKYTRNPQYLGDIIALIGAIFMVNSLYLTIASILGILIFVIIPLAEEPWLGEKYGEEYLSYCERVPRFIGLRRRKTG